MLSYAIFEVGYLRDRGQLTPTEYETITVFATAIADELSARADAEQVSTALFGLAIDPGPTIQLSGDLIDGVAATFDSRDRYQL